MPGKNCRCNWPFSADGKPSWGDVKIVTILINRELVTDEIDLEVGHERRRKRRSQIHPAALILAGMQEERRGFFFVARQPARFVAIVA